jgi:hypothetical protein
MSVINQVMLTEEDINLKQIIANMRLPVLVSGALLMVLSMRIGKSNLLIKII